MALDVFGEDSQHFLLSGYYETITAHVSNICGDSYQQDRFTGDELFWVASLKRGLIVWRFPWPLSGQWAEGVTPGYFFVNILQHNCE